MTDTDRLREPPVLAVATQRAACTCGWWAVGTNRLVKEAAESHEHYDRTALLSERDRWEEQALDAATRERLRLDEMGELLERIAELDEAVDGLLRLIGPEYGPKSLVSLEIAKVEQARSLLSEAQPSLSSSGSHGSTKGDKE